MAVYLRNRVPSSALNEKSPFESLHGSKPDLSNARVFGCTAYAHVVDKERKNWTEKLKKLRFVGYSLQAKEYRLYSKDVKRFTFDVM